MAYMKPINVLIVLKIVLGRMSVDTDTRAIIRAIQNGQRLSVNVGLLVLSIV